MTQPLNTKKPLQRTKADFVTVGVISAIALIGVGTVWATAPIRGSELTPAAEPFVAESPLTTIPTQLSERWRASDDSSNHKPSITAGVIATAEGNTVKTYSPEGELLWSYERDKELCALSTGFDSVVATYKTGVGCGDVIAINANDGQYKATRSAIASDTVAPITSNDRIGILGTERVELWRSDLVRTVEYGEVEAPQEANQQPNPDCSITSAMTRRDLLAVTETCPDESTYLRFMTTAPEDSRVPEVSQDIKIEDGRLIAIGETAAAVYVSQPTPAIVSYNAEGQIVGQIAVDPVEFSDLPSQQTTADLTHHMSWFTGDRLILLSPSQLNVRQVFDDALGTGTALNGSLLYPTTEGIAVANWDTGKVLRTIPVDRAGYTGEVSLGLVGQVLVEKRGSEIVALG
ncbi:hypothetical protein CDES_03895 [Corynebacterium deserti GIMN1.010]|uniref:Uncharacterized protein n=1 Tax=Corynebacterium deserti GIMN1.010 TaxID=931089 RepID=A0A0M5ITU7_9CORY|nr:hypothetical protein [Corynebacterium deserti]ALC05231.1 hypothetical protein CDES_03895 [Corynebacterium deserti GIMN1.010]